MAWGCLHTQQSANLVSTLTENLNREHTLITDRRVPVNHSSWVSINCLWSADSSKAKQSCSRLTDSVPPFPFLSFAVLWIPYGSEFLETPTDSESYQICQLFFAWLNPLKLNLSEVFPFHKYELLWSPRRTIFRDTWSLSYINNKSENSLYTCIVRVLYWNLSATCKRGMAFL